MDTKRLMTHRIIIGKSSSDVHQVKSGTLRAKQPGQGEWFTRDETCLTGYTEGSLVYFNHTVYFASEPEAGKEADCSGEKEEQEYHYSCISKVQEG